MPLAVRLLIFGQSAWVAVGHTRFRFRSLNVTSASPHSGLYPSVALFGHEDSPEPALCPGQGGWRVQDEAAGGAQSVVQSVGCRQNSLIEDVLQNAASSIIYGSPLCETPPVTGVGSAWAVAAGRACRPARLRVHSGASPCSEAHVPGDTGLRGLRPAEAGALHRLEAFL